LAVGIESVRPLNPSMADRAMLFSGLLVIGFGALLTTQWAEPISSSAESNNERTRDAAAGAPRTRTSTPSSTSGSTRARIRTASADAPRARADLLFTFSEAVGRVLAAQH
jgi:hypothetical protein